MDFSKDFESATRRLDAIVSSHDVEQQYFTILDRTFGAARALCLSVAGGRAVDAGDLFDLLIGHDALLALEHDLDRPLGLGGWPTSPAWSFYGSCRASAREHVRAFVDGVYDAMVLADTPTTAALSEGLTVAEDAVSRWLAGAGDRLVVLFDLQRADEFRAATTAILNRYRDELDSYLSAPKKKAKKPKKPKSYQAMALTLLVDYPKMSNKAIADELGIHEKSLYRYKEFMDARRLLKDQSLFPRGKKDAHGNIEAWDDG